MRPLLTRTAAAGRVVRRLVGWRRYGLAALVGALSALALPPVYAVPLLVPAFTVLIWLIDGSATHKSPWRAAVGVGWCFGLGHFLAGIYWIAFALLTFPDRFGWMVPVVVPGLAASLAIFPGLAAWAVWRSGTRGVGRVLCLAGAWTIMELARGHLLTGFPWNLIGSAWAWSEAMIQLAAATGAYGLSLLTVAAGAMPAILADNGAEPLGGARRTALFAVAGALVLVWGAGTVRLAVAPSVGSAAANVPDVRLRLVQANIDQRHKWRGELRQANLMRHLNMTMLPGFEAVTHVIWPETAVPFFIANDRERRALVASVVPAGGLVITGAPRTTPVPSSPTKIWNALHAIDAAGLVVGTYDKFHLVPFGEYMPLRRTLGMSKITHGRTDFSPGPGLRTLELLGLPPVSPLICYEAIFPGRVLNPARRPSWLLNITNDAWFGHSSGPYQHFASARFRTVEEGLPLVRVANTGISAVVDGYGRLVAYLGLGRAGVLDTALPAAIEGRTPYARYGDWILWILLATVILLSFILPSSRPGAMRQE